MQSHGALNDHVVTFTTQNVHCRKTSNTDLRFNIDILKRYAKGEKQQVSF